MSKLTSLARWAGLAALLVIASVATAHPSTLSPSPTLISPTLTKATAAALPCCSQTATAAYSLPQALPDHYAALPDPFPLAPVASASDPGKDGDGEAASEFALVPVAAPLDPGRAV